MGIYFAPASEFTNTDVTLLEYCGQTVTIIQTVSPVHVKDNFFCRQCIEIAIIACIKFSQGGTCWAYQYLNLNQHHHGESRLLD